MSNLWEWKPERLLEWHREKAGTVEMVHDIVKNELAAGVLPCGRFGANAAWLRACEVEGTVWITSEMSHADFLGRYPNDALLHTFLVDCRSRPGVRNVIYGLQCAKTTLNDYKRRFGFRVVDMPIYRWLNPGVRTIANWTRYRHYLEG